MTKSNAHPGFAAVAESIAKRGIGGRSVSPARARAILASRTRAASPAARKRNPRLNRVRGSSKRGK